MYKFKKNNKSWSCCPMGTLHDDVVDCYYFGIVKVSECETCNVRKDKKIIKKGES